MNYLKVLIVEDEWLSARLLIQLIKIHFPVLQVIGYAPGVEEALEFLKTNEIDLLLADVDLKGRSAFDLLDKQKDRKYPFIILSATKEAAFKTFEYGGSGYLLKPVNRNDLSAAIRQVVQRSAFSKSDWNN